MANGTNNRVLAQDAQPPSSERRSILLAAIYGFVSLISTGLGIPALLYLFVPPRARNQGAWIDAGTVDQFEPNKPQEITLRRNRVDGWKVSSEKATAWVVKSDKAEVTAFSPWCTHLGCAYHWEESRDQFVCPCHGSYFSMDGQVIAGPAPRPLDRYDVRIEGTRVWLGAVRPSDEAKS
jgi:quinol---cytochrome c reductase iron-sulfur subunit, bacillus type